MDQQRPTLHGKAYPNDSTEHFYNDKTIERDLWQRVWEPEKQQCGCGYKKGTERKFCDVGNVLGLDCNHADTLAIILDYIVCKLQ